jgi:hypothetical protein
MTPAERTALAAALRWARHTHEYRSTWWASDRDYAWYARPHTGQRPPVLRLVRDDDGHRVLEFNGNRIVVDSPGFALAVLAWFGIYDPADDRSHPYRGEPGPASFAVGAGPGRRAA